MIKGVHNGLFNKFMSNQLVVAGRMLFNGFEKASVRPHNVLMINVHPFDACRISIFSPTCFYCIFLSSSILLLVVFLM